MAVNSFRAEPRVIICGLGHTQYDPRLLSGAMAFRHKLARSSSARCLEAASCKAARDEVSTTYRRDHQPPPLTTQYVFL